MEGPLVSVVIPAYNCAGTILEAVESALLQEVDLEILVIDDCSKDNLEEVMKNYQENPVVFYIKNEKNLGASGSRNRGVSMARGKYTAFLDADDWWEKEKLTKQLAKMKETECVLCGTARELLRPDGTSTGKVIPVKETITYRQMLTHNSINCSSVLALTDVLREFPMEHEEAHEDYLTWLRILQKYKRVCAVNEPLLKYRLSNTGKSGSKAHSAKMTFQVYRFMGFGYVKSAACFCSYAVHGIMKYGGFSQVFSGQSAVKKKEIQRQMKDLLKIAYSYALMFLLSPLRLFPVKKNRLLFAALTGGDAYEYACNPKYVCEYIRKEYPGEFELYWTVTKPKVYQEKESKEITFLKHYSLRSFYYLMTAKVIVTSGSYAPWFPFRKNQYLINTWHGGGAYKRLTDNYEDGDALQRKKLEFCANNISLFLSTCERATKCLFRGAFRYQGEIMECGMPRNDNLVRGETKEAAEKVRAYYGIRPEDKILLYAPTYRTPSKKICLDGEALADALKSVPFQETQKNGDLAKAPERWYVLFRAHRFQEGEASITVTGENVIQAGEYPDMQELLAAADMMITDYSSAIWDYSFLFRPCFLFVPDLEEYTKKTGFYTDIHTWPFAMAKDTKELQKEILAYDPDASKRSIQRHHQDMGNKESGHACEQVAQRILKVCK